MVGGVPIRVEEFAIERAVAVGTNGGTDCLAGVPDKQAAAAIPNPSDRAPENHPP